VLGRLYEREKKVAFKGNQYMKVLEDNLPSSTGSNATAKAIASVAGVNEKTVPRATQFATSSIAFFQI